MSIEAMNWVLKHSTTKGAQRLVLLALANHADERGECWPSAQRIADEANIEHATAKRTLRALERAGHISKKVNAAPDKRMRHDRRTNLYRLLDGDAPKCPPWLDGRHKDDSAGIAAAHNRGASSVTPIHQRNPSQESSSSESEVRSPCSDDDDVPQVIVEAARHYAMSVVKRKCDVGQPPVHEGKYVAKVMKDWIERNRTKAELLLERDVTLGAGRLDLLCSEAGAAAANRLLRDRCEVCEGHGHYYDESERVVLRCACVKDGPSQ